MAERLRLRDLHASRWLDPALAIGLALVSLAELWAASPPDSALAPVFVLAFCGTLVFRRSHVVAATAVGTAVLLVAAAIDVFGDTSVAPFAAMSLLCYSCGAHASFRAGLLAVAVLVAAAQVEAGFADFPNVEIAFVTLAPWFVGREVRKRRQVVSALNERTRELEAEQDAFVRLSVRRERGRIARELHDIVAHHVAVMVVQAGAGRMAGTQDGTPARERLESIHRSGEQALAEMSRLVDIIKADTGSDRDMASRLHALVVDARTAGLRVDVAPAPGALRLPSEIEDDALRIVQEGLTNAMKHAPGARVSIELRPAGDSYEIEVRDDGGGTPSGLAQTGAGLGLGGMRERIESLGGSLEAGSLAEGGWRVYARLPLAARSIVPSR